MDWNTIGWKCKRQKKLIDFLIFACIALIALNIYLYIKSTDTRYTTMADLAAEAATHTYWRDMYDYENRQLNKTLVRLDEEYAAMQTELQTLTATQPPSP